MAFDTIPRYRTGSDFRSACKDGRGESNRSDYNIEGRVLSESREAGYQAVWLIK
nr:hypothetical protein [uncultured Dyadobacter sp.]